MRDPRLFNNHCDDQLKSTFDCACIQVHLMGKPAPVMYEEALQLLDLQPADVIAIGDSLVGVCAESGPIVFV